MFNRILVPLDGSMFAERALEPALNLAQANKSELILLRSVIPVHMMMPEFAGEYEWLWAEQSLDQSRLEASDYLESVRQNRVRLSIVSRSLVVDGDEASVIADTAEAEAADLIVMATHGFSSTTRWGLGSVTEKVLHSACCPVLIIRSEQPVHKILVTLDGSERAEQVLGPAVDVARGLDAEVILLHVNRPELVAHGALLRMERLVHGAAGLPVNRIYENVEQYLEKVAQTYQPQLARPVKTVMLEGPAAHSILNCATSEHIDLIAMCTHGRTGLRRWLYGSVAAKVLRGSQCSMLVIRPPVHELN